MNNDQLIDRIKHYWNTQPCNVKHSLSEPGTEQYWNEISERRYFVEPHLRDFAGFHQWRGKRVLEIGSGIGSDAVEFVRHGAEYVGIDLSAESVAMSRQRFDLFGLEGQFYVMDAADTDAVAALGKFDLVYSLGVLHHYPDMTTCLNNIYGALEDSGEFKMMVYAKNSWKYAMIRKGLDQFEAQAGCPYAQAYSNDEIYNLLEGQFEVLRIRQSHCFMYNVPKYRQGVYELESWFEAMPEEMRDAVKEYLGWHLLVKARKV
jgi:SAM-dependent methyltransferase